MSDLDRRAFIGLLRLSGVMALLLFVPAWTLAYWQAWLFLAVFLTAMLALTLYLMRHDPKLLERRLNAGPRAEKEKGQKIIIYFAMIAFVAMLVFPALDHRFGWSHAHWPAVVAGDGLVGLGSVLTFFVFKANSFTAAIIDVDREQKLVSSGPYAWVRHPFYFASLVMLSGMPLALGSWWGLLTIVPMLLVIVWRLRDEEIYLAKNLPGYADYRDKVRYRLLPLIW